jgi:hypothetical protein
MEIKYSDSNLYIGLKGQPPSTDNINPNIPFSGSSDGSTLKGEWDEIWVYSEGDIVWRTSATDHREGKAGVFQAKRENTNVEPPTAGLGAYENDDWEVFAPFQNAFTRFIDASDTSKWTEIWKDKITVRLADAITEEVFSVVIQPDTITVSGEDSNIKTVIHVGKASIYLDDYGTKVLIDGADVPVNARGKTFKIREVNVCVDGVDRKIAGLFTDVYD